MFCSRCQLLTCTSEKSGKKKNRKYRLRGFPHEWNESSNEHQEEIRRLLRKYTFDSLNKKHVYSI